MHHDRLHSGGNPGKTPDFLNSGRHDAVFSAELWETILAGRVWQGEIINRRKDGTLYNEEMTITPIREADGEIDHFIAIKKDITQHLRLNEQLHQMQKMEAIGLLAGGVAHDFNNLLTVIHGNAQFVLTDENRLNEESRRCLQQITDATERAANLTRQLLAFGRKQNIEFQPLNLNHVIDNFTKMLKRVIGEHVVLQYDYAENLPPINADVGMIEQILINLIVNARDAMPGGGSISITTESVVIDAAYVNSHPEAHSGNFVCFTVSDTGTGIYPEYLPRIFEPSLPPRKRARARVSVWRQSMASSNNIRAGSRYPASRKAEPLLKSSCRPEFPMWTGRSGANEPTPAAKREKILLVEDNKNAA